MAVNINVPSQVKTYTDLAAFPASGALKTIYIAEDTNKTYRWTGSVYVEVSAAGASGITIGTTAITSGTVGRVLFEGTGNVVQESANLFWDNTNGRLGIGTSSPAFGLDVNNFARIGGASIGLGLVTTFDGTYINLVRQGATTIIGSGSAGNAFIGTNSNHPFAFLVNGTSAGRISTTGNWLINTTTDAGFRLDVNGTARVSGILSLSSATGGIAYLQDTSVSSAYNIFSLSNAGGNFAIVSRTSTGGYLADHYGIVQNSASSSYQRWFTSGVQRMQISSTGNVLINTTTDAGFKLDVNGTARVSGDMTIATASGATLTLQSNNSNIVWTSGAFGIYFNTTRLVRFGNDGTIRFAQNIIVAGTTNSVIDSSAILQANSTTRGFLPPRMTTTEKNAIASPATGLMVYDNVLNRPCFYDGTTWITL